MYWDVDQSKFRSKILQGDIFFYSLPPSCDMRHVLLIPYIVLYGSDFTLLDAMWETDLWVWMVSSWSRHQSSSSRVSRDIRRNVSSAKTRHCVKTTIEEQCLYLRERPGGGRRSLWSDCWCSGWTGGGPGRPGPVSPWLWCSSEIWNVHSSVSLLGKTW